MAVIDHESETALDATQDRYGWAIHHQAAAAAIARRNNAAAAEAYTTHLAEHASHLLDAARHNLDRMPRAGK
ncbi:hypothetical protein SUDANB105_00747 [Streptomyces sp. enrichment culture]|uniref:hypothetical protein n=1 Tax=Streptomyces sp. enrichment culture TaxID=1795815 RepID=UPI003F57A02F